MRLLRRSGWAIETGGQTAFILCGQSSRCIGAVPPCAHARARPLIELHHPCCCPAAFHTWLPSAARTRLRTTETENAGRIVYMMSKTRAGVWRHTKPRTRARMWRQTRTRHSRSSSSSPKQQGRERGPSRPGCGGTAASTSCPCPTGPDGGGCGEFGGGGDIYRCVGRVGYVWQ